VAEGSFTFDGRPDPGLGEFEAGAVRRLVTGDVYTWVHGYSGRDAADFRRMAAAMAGGSEPTDRQRQIAQVLCVCRTEAGGGQRTFTVPLGNRQLMNACAAALEAGLPGPWIDMVCRESDAIALSGYIPPSSGSSEGAQRQLGELLGDDEFWATIDWLSTQLEGVPLCENDKPIAEVLTRATRDLEWRNRMCGVIGDLAAMAAGG